MSTLSDCIKTQADRFLWAYAAWDKSAESLARVAGVPYLGGFSYWDAGRTAAHGVALIARNDRRAWIR